MTLRKTYTTVEETRKEIKYIKMKSRKSHKGIQKCSKNPEKVNANVRRDTETEKLGRKAAQREVEGRNRTWKACKKIKAGGYGVKVVNSETRKRCRAAHFTGEWKVKWRVRGKRGLIQRKESG